MWIYNCTFLLSVLFFCFVSPQKNAKQIENYVCTIKNSSLKINRVALATLLASIPPMFISAVRYQVGTDYVATYYTGFYRVLEGSRRDKFEVGYYWINRIIQYFTDNVFYLFIITSVIFVGVSFKAIYELSSNIPLSIILFFVTRYYFVGMNGVRQFIAIAILTYSIRFVVEKNPKKYILCMLVAISVHYSSILFIPVYYLRNLKIPKRKLFAFIGIDICVFTIGMSIIISILSNTKYGRLLTSHEVCGWKFTIFTIAINILILLVSYKNYSKRSSDIKYCVYLNIQVVCLLITLVLRTIPLMERVYWIYSFPIIVTLPYLLEGIQKKAIRRGVTFLILIIFAVYMFYDIGVLSDHGAIPYQWIFGKIPIHDSGWRWYR